MGQKTNAKIFNLSLNTNKKSWDSIYFEKNINEESYILFKDNEIRGFLKQVFKLHGLFLHTIKIQYTDGTLDFYLSYYVSKKAFQIIKYNYTKNLIKIKFRVRRKRKNVKTKTRTHLPKKRIRLTKTQIRLKKLKRRLKKKQFLLKKNRVTAVKLLKTRLIPEYPKQKHFNTFSKYLLESLYAYTEKKLTIKATLQNLNKGLNVRFTNFELHRFKQIFIKLRKFYKLPFFKEALNIITIAMLKKNSAQFLADYIAFQLKLTTKHNFFIKFLKTTLTLFLKANLTNIKGIKLELKGRVNNSRRTKLRRIKLGLISLHSFTNTIDYSQSTAYTKKGTLGIKIWINEINFNFLKCFYSQKNLNTKKYKKNH